MKNILLKMGILTGVIILLITGSGRAQTVGLVNGSNTNPSAAQNNPPTGPWSNIWDWTGYWYPANGKEYGSLPYTAEGVTDYWYVINPNAPMSNASYYQNFLSAYAIESPYSDDALSVLNNNANSDYRWENGWELVARNFGYAFNETSPAGSDATVPYFILYNKYTGILRVFGVLPFGTTSQISDISVQLTFLSYNQNDVNSSQPSNWQWSTPIYYHDQNKKPYTVYTYSGSTNNSSTDIFWQNYGYTGIFNTYSGNAQALDCSTNVVTVGAPAQYAGIGNTFIYADFPVAYDPCTCTKPSGFLAQFVLNSTASVTMQGSFFGTAQGTQAFADGQASLNFDPNNVKGSDDDAIMLNYGNINGLIQNAPSKNSFSSFLSTTLGYMSDALAFGSQVNKAADLGCNDFLCTGLSTDQIEGGLQAASILTNFLSTAVAGSSGSATPYILQGAISLTGTVTTPEQNGQANNIYVTNPGSQPIQLQYDSAGIIKTIPSQEFFNSTYHLPDYPKYNEILGVFALLQTPTVSHSNFTTPGGEGLPNYPSWVVDQWKITSPVQYLLNPAAHPDLQNTTISAALAIYSSGGVPSGAYTHGLQLAYPNPPGASYTQGNAMYVTPYVPLEQLSTLVPVIENNFVSGTNDANYTIYLKLIVNFVSTDIGIYSNITTQLPVNAPNSSTLMFTYPLNVVNTTTNFTGFPYTPISEPKAPGMPPVSEGSACSIYSTPGATINYTANETFYCWNHFVIDNSLSVSSGKQVVFDSYSGVDIEQGVTIGQGITFNTGTITHYTPVPGTGNYSTPANLTTWCQGTAMPSGFTSKYASNTLAPNVTTYRLSADAAAVPASPQEIGASLSVYPNPFTNSTTIKYSVPAAGNVELGLYDIMGNKVKDLQNGFQSSGDYTLNFLSGNLEDGVYLLRINSEEYTNTEKIVIVK